MKAKPVFSILFIISMLLAACTSATPTETAEQATQPPAAQPTSEPTVAVTSEVTTEVTQPPASSAPTLQIGSSATLGEFLVDGEGMTLYLFTRDTPNTPTCYDDCALSWPPLLADATPVAGAGVDANLIGVAPRTDGTVQVTYNGWPLYYFATDMQPGDTAGHDVNGVWFVISPTGEQVPELGAAGNSNTNSNANDNSNINGNTSGNANTNDNGNSNDNDDDSNDNDEY